MILIPLILGVTATKVLLSKGISSSQEAAHKLLQEFLDYGFILRVNPINNSKFFQPDLSRTWDDSAYFAWIFEGSQMLIILGAAVFLVVAFAFVMFPLWPPQVRNLSWYLMVLVSSLLALLIVIAIIRLIIFVATFFLKPPGIWLFPRLFEDVSVIDSFIPLWAWHKPSSDK